jgi:hypothetical protein
VYVCIASLVVSGFRAEQGILIGDAMQNLEYCTGNGMSDELLAELADRDILLEENTRMEGRGLYDVKSSAPH